MDVGNLEADALVADPRAYVGVRVYGEGVGALPRAVERADVEVGAGRGDDGAARAPRRHFGGRARRALAVEDEFRSLRVLVFHDAGEMLDDFGYFEVNDEFALDGIGVEGVGEDADAVGGGEALGEADELRDERRLIAAPGLFHLIEHAGRGAEQQRLQARFSGQPLQVDQADLRQIELAVHDGGEAGVGQQVARVQLQRLGALQVERQAGAQDMLDADDVRPRDFVGGFVRVDADGLLAGGGRGDAAVVLVREELERHAEHIDVLGLEESGFLVDVVGSSAEAAPDDLLAEELAGERAQPHNVRDGARVPALAEHTDGDDVADGGAGLAGLADGVDFAAQQFGGLLLGEARPASGRRRAVRIRFAVVVSAILAGRACGALRVGRGGRGCA